MTNSLGLMNLPDRLLFSNLNSWQGWTAADDVSDTRNFDSQQPFAGPFPGLNWFASVNLQAVDAFQDPQPELKLERTLTPAELRPGRYTLVMYAGVIAGSGSRNVFVSCTQPSRPEVRMTQECPELVGRTGWTRFELDLDIGDGGATFAFGLDRDGTVAIGAAEIAHVPLGLQPAVEWLTFMSDNHIEVRPFMVDFGDVTPGAAAEAKVTIRQARRDDKLLGAIGGHLDYEAAVSLEARGARPEITSDFSDRDDATKWLDLAAGEAREITLRLKWVDWVGEVTMPAGVVTGQLSLTSKTRTHGILDHVYAPIMLKATVTP